jgi:glycosyltransferase involved in cell wall biosynthesis
VSRLINRRRAEGAFPALTPRRVFFQSQVEPGLLTDAARRLGVKIAYRVNGDSLVDGSDLRAGETLTLVQESIRTADLVITQTERQRRLAEDNLGVTSIVIESGVRMRACPSTSASEGEHVLWVGRCDPIKRPWVFVELAKRFPDQRFVMLMTPGTRLLYDEIHAEAAGVPNLTMLDSRPHAEALALYDRALTVVSTSISEGMPNVMIEAAMAGRPFLSYAVDPGGLLADGRIGRCSANDFERLCADLAALLGDPELRVRIGDAARAHAEQHWDVEHAARAYLDAFEGLFA